MVGRFERAKDVAQELTENGAETVGNVAGIVADTVRDVAGAVSGEASAEHVGNIAHIVAGAVRDVAGAVGAVTREVGNWVSDSVEMFEAARAAREDHNGRPSEDF